MPFHTRNTSSIKLNQELKKMIVHVVCDPTVYYLVFKFCLRYLLHVVTCSGEKTRAVQVCHYLP